MIEYVDTMFREDLYWRHLFARVVSAEHCDHRSGLEKRVEGAECVHCGARLSEDQLEQLLSREA